MKCLNPGSVLNHAQKKINPQVEKLSMEDKVLQISKDLKIEPFLLEKFFQDEFLVVGIKIQSHLLQPQQSLDVSCEASVGGKIIGASYFSLFG